LSLLLCLLKFLALLQVFRRKKWRYLILDEAHMIKNWKSQRWQTLLRFNSKRRLLITGTPLQVRSIHTFWDMGYGI
jgi:SNF2 family DNA or RNA helicase